MAKSKLCDSNANAHNNCTHLEPWLLWTASVFFKIPCTSAEPSTSKLGSLRMPRLELSDGSCCSRFLPNITTDGILVLSQLWSSSVSFLCITTPPVSGGDNILPFSIEAVRITELPVPCFRMLCGCRLSTSGWDSESSLFKIPCGVSANPVSCILGGMRSSLEMVGTDGWFAELPVFKIPRTTGPVDGVPALCFSGFRMLCDESTLMSLWFFKIPDNVDTKLG